MIQKLVAILGVAVLLAALAPSDAIAQAASPPPDLSALDAAPVRLDHRELFRVRGTRSLPAAKRAADIEARIVALARDRSVSPDAIEIVPSALGLDLRVGDDHLMTLIPADAEMESVRLETLAAANRQGLLSAIADYRASREPEKLLRGALLSLLATLVLIPVSIAGLRLLRRLSASLEGRVANQIGASARDESAAGQRSQVGEVVASAAGSVRLILLIALIYVWAEFVLGQFPWTRWLSSDLLGIVLNPLAEVASSAIDYVPRLLFLITIVVLSRFALRLIHLYFSSLERRAAPLVKFDPEWAMPAYKLARTVVIVLTLVMVYPYLPGSGSAALEGISILGGIMLSLGASTAVSNVIAGYFNIFGRVFRIGDFIQVGDIRGEVTQVRLVTTRLRTVKNEEVTLPNASILASTLINYSALARSQGLILHTEVGIGYEVPWRQVHAMLEEAARRTSNVLPDPAPFILQRQLGDFAVVYQLNVYTHVSKGMMRVCSELHQNVLDLFNENGVQIMTPAYEGDPPAPKVVPREAWFTPPAKPSVGAGRDVP